MTQPVQEPLITRSVSALTWDRNQIFRRPDVSAASAGTTACYLHDLSWDGTGASVANDTWVEVVTGFNGTNERWLDEFCEDPAGDWGRNFDTGAITNTANSMYSAWGFVAFDVPDGTVIGAAINWVGTNIEMNTGTREDGMGRIMVYSENAPIPGGGVTLRCYQQSGGAADLTDAKLVVRRYEDFSAFNCEFAS